MDYNEYPQQVSLDHFIMEEWHSDGEDDESQVNALCRIAYHRLRALMIIFFFTVQLLLVSPECLLSLTHPPIYH